MIENLSGIDFRPPEIEIPSFVTEGLNFKDYKPKMALALRPVIQDGESGTTMEEGSDCLENV